MRRIFRNNSSIYTDIFNFNYSIWFSEIVLNNLANGISVRCKRILVLEVDIFLKILISSNFYIVFAFFYHQVSMFLS